jgi:hypothetical protein
VSNISTLNKIFRIVLILGLIAVVLNGSGPLGAMVYLPFISIYAGITAFIGWDPVHAVAKKLEKTITIKHSHTHNGDLLAH